MKGKAKKLLGTMVLMAALICLACTAAFASTSVDIHVNGLGTTPEATYTATQLATTPFTPITRCYSSYKCKDDSYHYYKAYGPTLASVLSQAGVTYDSNDTINFYDGTWNTGELNLDSIINDGWYYPAGGGDPSEVEAIIALQFCEGINGTPTSTDCLRNFHGQPYGSPGADTASDWCKDLDDINVTQ